MHKFCRIPTRVAIPAILLTGAIVCLAWLPGRMTGGGSVITPSGLRVTHGFELHCQFPEGAPIPSPNSLEINWDSGNHWHLDNLTLAECTSDGLSPAPPPSTASGFDVYHGAGTGNGVPGVSAEWVFTDHGEPGTNDTASYHIVPKGACPGLAVATTPLTFGNHQAHDE